MYYHVLGVYRELWDLFFLGEGKGEEKGKEEGEGEGKGEEGLRSSQRRQKWGKHIPIKKHRLHNGTEV